MAAASLGTVLHHLRRLAGMPGAAEPTDARLLERFRRDRDEAAALAKGMLQAMFITKLRIAAATLLVLGVVAGVGRLAHQALAGRPGEEKPPARGTEEAKPARTDRYGDPLPDGAVARLGTVRWRHPGEAGRMVFSPDGKVLASVCSGG